MSFCRRSRKSRISTRAGRPGSFVARGYVPRRGGGSRAISTLGRSFTNGDGGIAWDSGTTPVSIRSGTKRCCCGESSCCACATTTASVILTDECRGPRALNDGPAFAQAAARMFVAAGLLALKGACRVRRRRRAALSASNRPRPCRADDKNEAVAPQSSMNSRSATPYA